MKPEIIQHHDPVDIRAIFEQYRNGMTGPDPRDHEQFFYAPGAKHSFMASATGNDRIKSAIQDILSVPGHRDIVMKADRLMIMILNSDRTPLTIKEITYLNDFVTTLPSTTAITWVVTTTVPAPTLRILLLTSHPE